MTEKKEMTTMKNTTLRSAGTTLAAGGILLAVGLVFHGPLQATLADQMHVIEHGGHWQPVHWVAATALSLFAMSGLIALSAGSGLARTVPTTIAWAAITVGAILTLLTALLEATAMTHVAAAGDAAAFETWWTLAGGLANGFALLALGIAVVAIGETRDAASAMPAWLPWIGALSGLGSVAGWIVGSWVGFAPASLVWVASSLVMCLWMAIYGVMLLRLEPASAGARSAIGAN